MACLIALVQLRVIEGEGAVYPAGGRASRGITVQVSDATGAPVEGASVNFRLPEEGPGGVFGNGQRSERVTTQADGRATVWGMQWNNTPGPFEIRITAIKDQARAGVIATQQLTEALQIKSGGTGTFAPSHHFSNKWVVIGLVAAGAGAGVVFATHSRTSTAASSTPTVPTVIGAPSITIGHP